MPELDAFERNLQAALRAFAERGAAPVDAVAFTEQVAVRRRPHHLMGWLAIPRLAWLLLLAALLTALLASALFLGAQPTDDRTSSGWTRVVFPEAEGISEVIDTPTGFLAVGQADHGPSHANAAAWTSTDCREWARVPRSEALEGGWMEGVARIGDVIVGVGDANAWTSPDGRVWQRVRPGLWVDDITVLADRFIAVGSTQMSNLRAWSSSDGQTWQPAERFDPPGIGPIWRAAIVTAGEAVLGYGSGGRGESIWRSTDGMTWTRVLDPDQATGAMLSDLAAAPDGSIVAVGNLDADSAFVVEKPVVWSSADGVSWSVLADMGPFGQPADATPAVVRLDSVAWVDGLWIILGRPGLTGEQGRGAGIVWTSVDGRTWNRAAEVPASGSADAWQAFACGDQVLVTGDRAEGDGAIGWIHAVDLLRAPSVRLEPAPAVSPRPTRSVSTVSPIWTRQYRDVSAVAFSPDGELLAAAANADLALLDLDTGDLRRILPSGAATWETVWDIEFGPDSALIAAVSGQCGSPAPRVRVSDVDGGELPIQQPDDFDHMVTSVAFSPDGSKLAVGTGCGFSAPDSTYVKVWDTATGVQLLDMPMPAFVEDVAFSPDGTAVAVAHGAGTNLWDVATGGLRTELRGAASGDGWPSLAFSPDGTRLASTGREAQVWDVVSGDQLCQLEGPSSDLHDVTFSPDGRYVVGCGGGAVRSWDATTGAVVAEHPVDVTDGGALPAETSDTRCSLAVAGDTALLATYGWENDLRLWRISGP